MEHCCISGIGLHDAVGQQETHQLSFVGHPDSYPANLFANATEIR